MFLSRHRPTLLARVTALLCVALLGLLWWTASDLRVHAELGCCATDQHHAHAPVPDGDHRCVITDFSHGGAEVLVFAGALPVLPRPLPEFARIGVSASPASSRPALARHAPTAGPPLVAV